jgi:hypothetical protein
MNRRTDHHLSITPLESLEDRLALSATPVNPLETAVAAHGGPVLGSIYTEYFNYVVEGSKGTFNPPEAAQVEMTPSTVKVDIRFGGGNFVANATALQNMGMVFTSGVPSLNLVEGSVPIGQLPSVAADDPIVSLSPVYKPTAYASAPVTPAVPAGPIAPVTPTPITPATPAAPMTVAQGVALKGGPDLGSIYQEYVNYEQAGGTGTFMPSEAGRIEFRGTSVNVSIRTPVANFTAMLGQMKALGMQVTGTVQAGQVGVIEGYMPIGQLPQVAINAGLVGMAPVYKPTAY